ncbi:MAG: hypothetical protein KJ060_08850 [Candidatus Hydrogenedentes bacterium]|nr:hypothetical protein [Candidatus Hydrogenedentota bacterium]
MDGLVREASTIMPDMKREIHGNAQDTSAQIEYTYTEDPVSYPNPADPIFTFPHRPFKFSRSYGEWT